MCRFFFITSGGEIVCIYLLALSPARHRLKLALWRTIRISAQPLRVSNYCGALTRITREKSQPWVPRTWLSLSSACLRVGDDESLCTTRPRGWSFQLVEKNPDRNRVSKSSNGGCSSTLFGVFLAHAHQHPVVRWCFITDRFYHGHVEAVADIYSGQMGPLIVYEKGILDSDGLPSVSTPDDIDTVRRCRVLRATFGFGCVSSLPMAADLALSVLAPAVRRRPWPFHYRAKR